MKEYRTITQIAGPLVFVEKTEAEDTVNWSTSFFSMGRRREARSSTRAMIWW